MSMNMYPLFGKFVAVYLGGTGQEYVTDARWVFEMGSVSFGHGNSNYQFSRHLGTTKCQLQLKSKAISTAFMSRYLGINFGTGSYQTWSEQKLIAAGTASLTYTPMAEGTQDLLIVKGMLGNRWCAFDKVTGVPTSGQYSISGNVLTFNSADNGILLTCEYTYLDASSGLYGYLPANFVPSTMTGSLRLESGELAQNGKMKYWDSYFKDLQPTTERLEVGAPYNAFNDDYTEAFNVAQSSVVYFSEWTEP